MEDGNSSGSTAESVIETSLFTFGKEVFKGDMSRSDGTSEPYTFKASRGENHLKNKAVMGKKKNGSVMRSVGSNRVKACTQSSVGASGVSLVNVTLNVKAEEEKEKEKEKQELPKTSPKNYDCKLCGHTTSDPEYLEKHMNSTCNVMRKAREILNARKTGVNINNEEAKKAQGLETYDCNLCGYHVSTKKELEKHLRNTCKVIKAREGEQLTEKISLGRLDNSGASSSSSGQYIKMKYMKAFQ